MELFVISDPDTFKGEHEIINALFESGMSVFHLRKNGLTRAQYATLIESIPVQYHDRIALHQFHELSLEFPGIQRLHYPEWFRLETAKNQLPNQINGRVLSTSIHHLDDLQESTGFDYTFFGPVFNSISKPGYSGILHPGFKLPLPRPVKVIALGGITWSNLERIQPLGFDGIAVLGAIWNERGQTLNNFKNIQEKCRQTDLL
jgi:thiamine-phosphate pyrophosphorylase